VAEGAAWLAEAEPRFAQALEQTGPLPLRRRKDGFAALLDAIVSQQVSVAAADAIWGRMKAAGLTGPRKIMWASDDDLRACGLSRQKQGYARSLCELVEAGALDLDAMPEDDEEAIAQLTQIKGIGRWSAEIYLLFAEGRADIWPAGDLAVQEGVKRLLDLEERPKEKELREIGEQWSPHRGPMAIFTWHYYANPAL